MEQMEQTEQTEQPQQLLLERLRQVPQDLAQQSQTVAVALPQHWISAFQGEQQVLLAQLALRVQLALMALPEPMGLMVQQQQSLSEQSLQVPLVQAQPLRIAVVVLLRHLIFPFLEAPLVPQALRVQPGLMVQTVRTVLMVPMEAQTLF